MGRHLLFCALALAGAFAALVHGVVAGGSVAESWQLAARYTARFSFLIFAVVYAARPWHRLAPSAASRFVLKRRRSLGLAFATAHTVHLGALTSYFVETGKSPDLVTLVVGGGAYVAMFAMAFTSNDAAVRALGATRWQTIHRVGIHYLWFVFTFTYGGRMATAPAFFAPLFVIALGVAALRFVAWRAKRTAQPSASSARAA